MNIPGNLSANARFQGLAVVLLLPIISS